MTKKTTTSTTAIHVLAVETDTRLSALYQAEQSLQQKFSWNTKSIRREAGQKQSYRRTGDGEWSGTLKEALGFRPSTEWGQRSFDKLIAERMELNEALKANEREQQALQAVWAANGRWSRFFLVLNNNGHIHSSLHCSTTYPTTSWAWLPQLSGLAEAEAVADQGEILCSICFPTAPVAWTDGTSKASKEGKAQRAAEKLERDAKRNAKNLYADGSTLRAGRERIVTLFAAKAYLTDVFHDYEHVRAEHGEFKEVVAEALAARLGTTPEVEIAAAKDRADKRRKREQSQRYR